MPGRCAGGVPYPPFHRSPGCARTPSQGLRPRTPSQGLRPRTPSQGLRPRTPSQGLRPRTPSGLGKGPATHRPAWARAHPRTARPGQGSGRTARPARAARAPPGQGKGYR
ncbi:hypothetical protein GCM10017750_06260 [Streptomyces racemochromogenes]